MFYIFSKLLAIFSYPITWFFILLIASLIFKNKRLKSVLIFSSFVIIYTFSNQFILNSLKNKWVVKPISEEKLEKNYDFGIVLGGFSSLDEPTGMIDFNQSSDRLFYAVKLYQQKVINKIIITGGSAKLVNKDIKEADFVEDFLIDLNIPKDDIIIENQSRNTYENAEFTSEILGEEKDTCSFLLITSALHMKRAEKCFEKQDFNLDCYSVDYISDKEEIDLNYYLMPKISVIDEWSLFFHEILGYYIYKHKGYL